MPQMSPMWWEILFILFISMYLMTNMILYWMMETKVKEQASESKNNKELNWKL